MLIDKNISKYIVFAEDSIINALKKIGVDPNIQIIKDAFSEDSNEVWKRKFFFTNPSPNLDKVIKIASKIDADLVMLFYMKSPADDDIAHNSLYLVDPKEKVIVNKKYSDYIYNPDPFESKMRVILGEYLLKKRQAK